MSAFNDALQRIGDAELEGRYDPAAMAAEDVYLADAFVGEGRDALDYVMRGVPALRGFAASAAARGEGAIRIIS